MLAEAVSPLGDRDDEIAIRAIRAGELRAFDELARSYRSRIHGICFRYTGNRADAEDLAQEVLLRIYRGLESFRAESSFRTWVYRITVNVCLNWVASRKPFDALDAETPDARPSVLEKLLRGESRGELRRAVARLPDRQRMTVLLRVYEELSHKEIAEVMACPIGTVKANFFFALKNLRKRLGERRD
jgi:RNA polymerase sigma-70 factor (ECF subfamily)